MAKKQKKVISDEHLKALTDVMKDIPPALLSTPPIFFTLLWVLGRKLNDPFMKTVGWSCTLLSLTESEVAEGVVLAVAGADMGLELSKDMSGKDVVSLVKRWYEEQIKLYEKVSPIPSPVKYVGGGE